MTRLPTALQSAGSVLTAPGHEPQRLVEETVLLAASLTLVAVSGWLLLSIAVCSVGLVRDGRVALERPGRLRPRLVRALMAALVGAVVATSAPPSTTSSAASTPTSTPPRSLPGALEGLTLPDRTYGGVRTHQVVPGESLWSITAELLHRRAPNAVVARSWPRLHRLNLDRVGDDPDVLRPSTILRLPAWASVPTREAPR